MFKMKKINYYNLLFIISLLSRMRTGRANEHDDRRDERADVMATDDDMRMTAQMKPKMCVPRHRNRTGTGRKSRRLS